MGIPVVEGRAFQRRRERDGRADRRDHGAHLLAWGEPIGHRLKPGFGADIPWFTIVGVLKDVKQGGVDQKTGTELCFNLEQVARSCRSSAASAR